MCPSSNVISYKFLSTSTLSSSHGIQTMYIFFIAPFQCFISLKYCTYYALTLTRFNRISLVDFFYIVFGLVCLYCLSSVFFCFKIYNRHLYKRKKTNANVLKSIQSKIKNQININIYMLIKSQKFIIHIRT